MKNKKSIKTRIHDKVIDIKEFVADHKKSLAVAGVVLTVGAVVIYKKGCKHGKIGACDDFLDLLIDASKEQPITVKKISTGEAINVIRF